MSKRRKIMFGILGIIMAIAVIGTVAIKYHLSSNEKVAGQIAKDYLAQKYEQEMQFRHVQFSWIDPCLYHVTFTPVNAPELYFQVIVQQDLTIKEDLREFGHNTCPDNYLLNYFTFYTSREIEKVVQNIWGVKASAYVPCESPALYSYYVPFEINEHMSAKEMEPFLDYDCFITTNRILNSESKQEEAQRMLNVMKLAQASKYKPEKILFWYQTENNEKKTVLTDSKAHSKLYIEFNNWSEISSTEAVVQAIDEQWFRL